jgi:hypothetical protein
MHEVFSEIAPLLAVAAAAAAGSLSDVPVLVDPRRPEWPLQDGAR